MKTYLINLDRDSDRMQHMSFVLKKFNIEFERVSAVEGKLLPDDFYQEFCNKIQRRDWPKGGQLGCFLSHFKVWELVANGSEDFALILEDDIHFSADIKKLLSSYEWLPVNFDIVRLEVSTNKLLLEKATLIEGLNRKIAKLSSTSWCAGAYIVSKECAKKIINIDPKSYQSVDALIFSYEDSPIPSRLNIYQITPAVAIQDKYSSTINTITESQGFKSGIDNEHSYLEKLLFNLRAILKRGIFSALIRVIKGYKKVQFKD